MMLPLWEDVLPNVPDAELAARSGTSRGRDVTSTGPLARRLGTGDAVVIGLGSMIGAGVFSAFGPAARAAGSGLLIALALAAGVAYCNAVASAQLAAEYPTSGGTYVYGRERLGEWWGFLAGWGFVVGKTASCAAMALTFAAYAVPGLGVVAPARRPRGSGRADRRQPARDHEDGRAGARARGAVGARAARRRRGDRDRRRRRLADTRRAVVALAPAASTGFSRPRACSSSPSPATPGSRRSAKRSASPSGRSRGRSRSRSGSPSGSTCSSASPPSPEPARSGLAASSAPIVAAVKAAGAAWASPVVRVGAAIASLGALLALIAGHRSHRPRDGPERRPAQWLAAVDPRRQVPHHAELAVAAVVAAPRADHRPARCDRLLLVRRPHVLRDRQRSGVHPDR